MAVSGGHDRPMPRQNSHSLRAAFLLAAMIVLSPHSASTQQVGPPCCATPDIVAELNGRPAGESPAQLREWLQVRNLQRSDDEIRLDLAADEGVCVTRCSPNFFEARGVLSLALALRSPRAEVEYWRREQGREIDYPGCCSDNASSSARQSETRPVINRPAAQAPLAVPVGPRFRSTIIQQLRAWTGDIEEIRDWLKPQLEQRTMDEVELLYAAVASWCEANPSCSHPMKMGKAIIAGHIEFRRAAQAARVAAQAHEEEVSLRRGDWWATIIAGIIGGLIALVGAFAPIIFGQRHARRNAAALEGTLAQLNKTLVSLGSQKSDRQGQGPKRQKPKRAGADR